MDVNEHDRETIQHYTCKEVTVKDQCFYCCSAFHSPQSL